MLNVDYNNKIDDVCVFVCVVYAEPFVVRANLLVYCWWYAQNYIGERNLRLFSRIYSANFTQT